MHAAACGGLAPARCRNRSIKRHAYAFELRPLWPRNERRASSRAGRAHDGTKPMQHACRPAKGTPAAEAAALRQRSAGRQPLDGCLRPSSPSPSFSPSDPFLRLPSRACLSRPHRHKSWQRSRLQLASRPASSRSGHRCPRHEWALGETDMDSERERDGRTTGVYPRPPGPGRSRDGKRARGRRRGKFFDSFIESFTVY